MMSPSLVWLFHLGLMSLLFLLHFPSLSRWVGQICLLFSARPLKPLPTSQTRQYKNDAIHRLTGWKPMHQWHHLSLFPHPALLITATHLLLLGPSSPMLVLPCAAIALPQFRAAIMALPRILAPPGRTTITVFDTIHACAAYMLPLPLLIPHDSIPVPVASSANKCKRPYVIEHRDTKLRCCAVASTMPYRILDDSSTTILPADPLTFTNWFLWLQALWVATTRAVLVWAAFGFRRRPPLLSAPHLTCYPHRVTCR